MKRVTSFPFFRQSDIMDCGPACLKMVTRYYDKEYSLTFLKQASNFEPITGATMQGLELGLKQMGFEAITVRITLKRLTEEVPLPCILHWNKNHFVILYSIEKSPKVNGNVYFIADPALGHISLKYTDFAISWLSENLVESKSILACGIALLIKPNSDFHFLDINV